MHIDIVPNRQSKPAILLRESYREGPTVRKRTLANLSNLPMDQVESIRQILKGERLVAVDEVFEVVENGSPAHGHVEAVRQAMTRLGFDRLIGSRPSRERNMVAALVAARILEPQSKLATTRWWHTTTLPDLFGVADATEDDVYEAMDWVLERQERIERKLAARHLENGGLALYDLTSSYFEGTTCPLAQWGHNRDGKKGKLQVNYGLLTNRQGIPVSVSVFEGNTGDPKTLLPQVRKVKDQFGIEYFTIVGDRGMITQTRIDELRGIEGLDWITALRPEGMKTLLQDGAIQMGLFDQRNLFELTHPDFPGERLVACRNPDLARRRAHKREDLIEATRKELEKVRQMVQRNRLEGSGAIRSRVHKVLNKYTVGQYYTVDIRDSGFDFQVGRDAMEADLSRAASPEAARRRRQRWTRHIEKIDQELGSLRQHIGKGALHGTDKIGVRVGKVLNKYKVGKHFKLDIGDNRFEFEIDEEKVTAEAALDGIYVIRTSLSPERISADDAVRGYKLLTQVERAFRSFKTLDLHVRPIRHRLENRVRAHIFLCMLAYYAQWHMMEAWRPLLFADEDQDAKAQHDPVAPAQRSEGALRKVHTRMLDDDTPVHSFRTLLSELARIARNTCRRKAAGTDEPTFEMITPPNATQHRAYQLLKTIIV
ncbi:MAG: IS1634 family transposase [Chloroflexi bacterium]|nr:IS1634 family transposase [Chloroflexota bacterium]